MNDKSENKKKEILTSLKEWIKSIAIALIAAIFIQTFIFNIVYVKGDSMSPTLEERDRLILKKYETLLKIEDYQRGDIIIFKSPLENDDRSFIKRIIGLPGDQIIISNGDLYVNDQNIEEPYIAKDSFTEPLTYGDDYIVLENEIFVIGDNRLPGKSNDSRSFGSIPLNHVEGKIIFRIFPFNRIDGDL